MSHVGYRAQNHPGQVGSRGALDGVDDRATPPEVFGPLHKRFGFTVDVCASARNTKCERFYTSADNGLDQPWAGDVVWCNPPFSRIRPWLVKAWAEQATARGIVMLLPSNRTEQTWWQQLVEPYRDRPGSPLTTEFLPGRIRFLRPWQDKAGPNERPPFGCCVLIWHAAPRPAQQLGLDVRTPDSAIGARGGIR